MVTESDCSLETKISKLAFPLKSHNSLKKSSKLRSWWKMIKSKWFLPAYKTWWHRGSSDCTWTLIVSSFNVKPTSSEVIMKKKWWETQIVLPDPYQQPKLFIFKKKLNPLVQMSVTKSDFRNTELFEI